ncbi:GlcG/HbpS family heme-binding protein [Agrobacterium tumefaciens]|uniref:GlcG/HbpS family heme-binding protein n=1 Tax=Agrobacterium tumefaciens TaxID=358 RepID=UPI00220DF196|nr:heme-binding protein [Agrobacterium tumefaciens]UXT00406.1 heme-binding protein [Agrobacterium tumefaciens]
MQTELTTTVRDLSLVAAQKLLANGLDHAAKNDMRLAISVVDRAGNLLAFARMDGASIVTVGVAVGKARTAAFLKAPSKLFEDMINSGKPSMATVPGLLPLQGGMPIVHEGEVVGAVGVSGSSGDNDQAAAALIAESFAQL